LIENRIDLQLKVGVELQEEYHVVVLFWVVGQMLFWAVG